jgi:hypothetical protein
MRVLYWSIPNLNVLQPNMVSDYQSDMLFHGLRKVLGKDCVDAQRFWWMYSKDKEERPDDFPKIWGKGFTMYGLLDDEEVDRTTIPEQLVNNEFDMLVLPLHHSIAQMPEIVVPMVKNSLRYFEGKQIAIIDGWDQPYIAQELLNLCRQHGIKYFKRELTSDIEGVYPISFAFPEEKISDCMYPMGHLDRKNREHVIAPLIPVNQSIDPSYMSTYIYDTEESYYEMYQNSQFALTSRKGGWDTLRHYEIMANGCIPLFVDIDNCPKNCLWNFPKELCHDVMNWYQVNINLKKGKWTPGDILPHCGVIDRDNPGNFHVNGSVYTNMRFEFRHHLLDNLTTVSLAQYILRKMLD